MSNEKKHGKAGASTISEVLNSVKRLGGSLTDEELAEAMDALKLASDLSHERESERREALRPKEAEENKPEPPEDAITAAPYVEDADGDGFDDGITELPLDFDDLFAPDIPEGIHAESISDGLTISLTTNARVDIPFIAKITGNTPSEVIEALRGSIFQNPARWEEDVLLGWETADEYLSGNLISKWREAKRANKLYDGRFTDNVEALDRLLPPSVATDDIYVTIGSPWLPADVIDDFIKHITKVDSVTKFGPDVRTCHNEELGLWEIPFKTRFRHTITQRVCTMTYGTDRMEMLYLLENTLNMKSIAIYDEKPAPGALPDKRGKIKTIRVLNEADTLLAVEKQGALLAEFGRWIWTDEDRKERLQQIYDERYGAIKRRVFNGSFLSFPDMNPSVTLYDYQKNAVARMILTPNTLLAHDVGSGKTFEMAAAGMEMRRMGISKKNMYVVPCNLTKQWEDAFLKVYPKARLLMVDPKSFTPQKRTATLLEMRDGDYDAIIIAYSCFDMIPLSADFYKVQYEEAAKMLEEAKKTFRSEAAIASKKRVLERALEKVKAQIEAEKIPIAFDSLGVNTLFVDEAHNYKNVPIDTKVSGVLGISGGGSDKCKKMLEKAMSVQKANGGRGVILATGTPITNSITDVYVMQKFLQSGELALLGLQSFDSWIGMFAERTSEFEVDVDTGNFRLATRFSRFHNLPELTSILASVADFHHVGKEAGLPEFDDYTDTQVKPTLEFKKYLECISERADDVRAHRVSRKVDNMLKITTDGRKAALDLRLVNEKARFTSESKVAWCANKVYDIYLKTHGERGTQLVFCDSSTPKAEFNMYDELRRLLVLFGIPDGEIAYIHDATTEKRRAELFANVREGKVRVLIGSTFKLGLGVNVQDKLFAIHHLDVPWRPADMVQRQGRILRQGNTNEVIEIHRYITQGSFDAYSWQLLETKQRFISQILSGTLTERDGGDVDNAVLGYAEVKALAIGNPLIKRRVEVSNELSRQLILQKELVETRQSYGQELIEVGARIERQEELISLCEEDIAFYREEKREYTKEEEKDIREMIDRVIRTHADMPYDTEILEYQGFRVLAPAYMSAQHPYVYLMKNGKYRVELNKEAGIVKRLDFFLEEFDRQLEAFVSTLEKLKFRRDALSAELESDKTYVPRIEELKRELEEIDKELGVKKQ